MLTCFLGMLGVFATVLVGGVLALGVCIVRFFFFFLVSCA